MTSFNTGSTEPPSDPQNPTRESSTFSKDPYHYESARIDLRDRLVAATSYSDENIHEGVIENRRINITENAWLVEVFKARIAALREGGVDNPTLTENVGEAQRNLAACVDHVLTFMLPDMIAELAQRQNIKCTDIGRVWNGRSTTEFVRPLEIEVASRSAELNVVTIKDLGNVYTIRLSDEPIEVRGRGEKDIIVLAALDESNSLTTVRESSYGTNIQMSAGEVRNPGGTVKILDAQLFDPEMDPARFLTFASCLNHLVQALEHKLKKP